MKKHFLIASFSGSFAPAPRLTSRDPRIAPPFLFNTNKAHRIIIPICTLMKTKEKDFSIQYKSALLTNRRRRRSPRPRFPLRAGLVYSAGPMLDLGYVREHLDVIEKMARDRGLTLDLAPFREIDSKRRELIRVVEVLKAERNKESKDVGILMSAARAMARVQPQNRPWRRLWKKPRR